VDVKSVNEAEREEKSTDKIKSREKKINKF
jgi:hypothetical protein